MGAALDLLDTAALWRGLNVMASLWLAIVFGRTLRAGRMPLVEQIARASDPELPPVLCRYTWRLTAYWSAYFVAAAMLSAAAVLRPGWTVILIVLGAVALFVGEHRLRPHFFPGRRFPGLVRQLRDTWCVWWCRL